MAVAAARWLVTGGAGFLGSHLVERLAARGDEVTVLDDLSTGRVEHLAGALATGRVRLVAGDAKEAVLLRAELRGVAGVFHLAASVGVMQVVAAPLRTLDNLVLPTRAVLAAAAAVRAKVVYASTSEVYGRGVEAPFHEEQDLRLGPPTRLRWAYACAKLLGEMEALATRKEHGTQVAIARIFNTVGPRQSGRYGMVLPRLVGQALRGEPLTVFGDGLQSRAFCHVEDTVGGLIALMDAPAADGHVVNLGGTDEVTILELARRVLHRTGSSAPVQLVPYEEAYGLGFDDMRRRVPAIEKARRLLGWAPTRDLDAIIDGVAAYLRAGGHSA